MKLKKRTKGEQESFRAGFRQAVVMLEAASKEVSLRGPFERQVLIDIIKRLRGYIDSQDRWSEEGSDGG